MTDRQMHVWRELAKGKADKEIARALGLAPSTVKVHMENLRIATGVRTRGQLIAIFYRRQAK